MNLEKLLEGVEIVKTNGNDKINIEKIVFDSASVEKNCLFICLDGHNSDGHDFASYAVTNGAIAVVCENDFTASSACVVKVKDSRKAMAIIAGNFYGNPARSLKIVSVVGTNGKSSTAYIASKLLAGGGKKCGLIGTMYYEIGNEKFDAPMTTPDPLELHALLKKMLDSGIEYVVMEVSAHAIYYKKMCGIKCIATIFTNLSQDHLDFFRNMDNYKNCKKSFFADENTCLGIVNADDECGKELVAEANISYISYGLYNPCDAFAIDVSYTIKETKYIANVADEILEVKTSLLGEFNVYNTLAACALAVHLGISAYSITQTLQKVEPPIGRFNTVTNGGITYVVDFAHTPDGLFNLLKESRKICKGRLITIFGCGGDRDVSKRPIMGKIASEMSDIVIVTTDNPRSESRKAIVSDILEGIRLKCKLYVELDRAKAVELGVELASSGDMVIVAGKGSESYIDENNIKTPYNDMTEVLCALENC